MRDKDVGRGAETRMWGEEQHEDVRRGGQVERSKVSSEIEIVV